MPIVRHAYDLWADLERRAGELRSRVGRQQRDLAGQPEDGRNFVTKVVSWSLLMIEAASVGRYSSDDAKMIGITPAWLTFSGM